uniref:Uncharacterized protein n=1 Tax=Trypanosoma congolense (strain IL3000) TaxID=1068625 RepID=G0V043_TRYCI|nr:conserved hypothetical protein [Trypanosoma congolense IL3000]
MSVDFRGALVRRSAVAKVLHRCSSCISGMSLERRCSTARSGGTARATPEDRRRIAQSWENAFLGRVHYEPGMHENFQAVTNLEEEERKVGLQGDGGGDQAFNWPDDEEAPLHEFLQLPDDLKRRYIIRRLVMGERRITHAPYYGSLLMMQHLNIGELMINEADNLLRECGWMNEAVASKIKEVRSRAAKVKFEHDLD